MADSAASLYDDLLTSEQHHLAELDALTVLHRSTLRQLLSEAASILAPLSSSEETDEQHAKRVKENEEAAPKEKEDDEVLVFAEESSQQKEVAAEVPPGDTAMLPPSTVAHPTAEPPHQQPQELQPGPRDKRRQSKTGPAPAPKRTRATRGANAATAQPVSGCSPAASPAAGQAQQQPEQLAAPEPATAAAAPESAPATRLTRSLATTKLQAPMAALAAKPARGGRKVAVKKLSKQQQKQQAQQEQREGLVEYAALPAADTVLETAAQLHTALPLPVSGGSLERHAGEREPTSSSANPEALTVEGRLAHSTEQPAALPLTVESHEEAVDTQQMQSLGRNSGASLAEPKLVAVERAPLVEQSSGDIAPLHLTASKASEGKPETCTALAASSAVITLVESGQDAPAAKAAFSSDVADLAAIGSVGTSASKDAVQQAAAAGREAPPPHADTSRAEEGRDVPPPSIDESATLPEKKVPVKAVVPQPLPQPRGRGGRLARGAVAAVGAAPTKVVSKKKGATAASKKATAAAAAAAAASPPPAEPCPQDAFDIVDLTSPLAPVGAAAPPQADHSPPPSPKVLPGSVDAQIPGLSHGAALAADAPAASPPAPAAAACPSPEPCSPAPAPVSAAACGSWDDVIPSTGYGRQSPSPRCPSGMRSQRATPTVAAVEGGSAAVAASQALPVMVALWPRSPAPEHPQGSQTASPEAAADVAACRSSCPAETSTALLAGPVLGPANVAGLPRATPSKAATSLDPSPACNPRSPATNALGITQPSAKIQEASPAEGPRPALSPSPWRSVRKASPPQNTETVAPLATAQQLPSLASTTPPSELHSVSAAAAIATSNAVASVSPSPFRLDYETAATPLHATQRGAPTVPLSAPPTCTPLPPRAAAAAAAGGSLFSPAPAWPSVGFAGGPSARLPVGEGGDFAFPSLPPMALLSSHPREVALGSTPDTPPAPWALPALPEGAQQQPADPAEGETGRQQLGCSFGSPQCEPAVTLGAGRPQPLQLQSAALSPLLLAVQAGTRPKTAQESCELAVAAATSSGSGAGSASGSGAGSASGAVSDTGAGPGPGVGDDAVEADKDAAAAAAAPPCLSGSGSNLVAAIRSFLPAKRPPSPVAAAGRKLVKVRALEAAQAAKKAEESKAADKARAKEDRQHQQHPQAVKPAVEGPSHEPATVSAPTGGAAGQVRLKAAAFQQRILDEEARGKEGCRLGAKPPNAHAALGSSNGSCSSQQDKGQAQPSAVQPKQQQQQAAGLQANDKARRVDQAAAGPFGSQAVPQAQVHKPDLNDKLKRAEMRRREEEEKRRADLEAKQKAKEDRSKAAKLVQAQQLTAANSAAAAAAQAKADSLRAGTAAATAFTRDERGGGAGAASTSAATGPLMSRSTNVPAAYPPPAAAGAGGKKAGSTLAVAAGTAVATGTPSSQRPGFAIMGLAVSGTASASNNQNAPTPSLRAAPATWQQHPPMTPAELAQEERNIQILVSSPYVNPGLHRTPGPRTGATNQVLSYEISPYKSESEEEEKDWEVPRPPGKVVPEWAQPACLAHALQKQQRMDPDQVFDCKLKTCPLEQIFAGMPPAIPSDPVKASKRRDWRKRGSSGNWIADRLTWQEEIGYKKQMGFC